VGLEPKEEMATEAWIGLNWLSPFSTLVAPEPKEEVANNKRTKGLRQGSYSQRGLNLGLESGTYNFINSTYFLHYYFILGKGYCCPTKRPVAVRPNGLSTGGKGEHTNQAHLAE